MKNTPTATEEDHTRFQFGKNWSQFLKSVDSVHILEAEHSLKEITAFTVQTEPLAMIQVQSWRIRRPAHSRMALI
jgi:hypothetical protein